MPTRKAWSEPPNVESDQQIGQQILGSHAYFANLSMARTSNNDYERPAEHDGLSALRLTSN